MDPKEQSKRTSSAKRTVSGVLTRQVREAVRKEMNAEYSRRRTLDTYASSVDEADSKVTDFIQQVIKETTRAFRTMVALYVVSYLAAVLALVSGLFLIPFQSQTNNFLLLAIVCIIGGVIGIIYMQNRNPVRSVRYMIDNLVKLNIIFAGYIRQIHQVDAVFEDMFASGKEIEPAAAEQMLSHLQDAMAEAMSAISQFSSDMHE